MTPHRRYAAALLAAAGMWMAVAAQASTVMLNGTIGSRAILIIDGAAPRTLAPGDKLGGVRLVSVQGDHAVVELDGQRLTLNMDSPVSVGGAPRSGGTRIVLPANSGGHFLTQGTINGRTVSFMLDTGATVVAVSSADATRIGLDYKNGQAVRINTANGDAVGYRLKLSSIRVGDVEVYDVDAVVSDQPMPYVLLGNSFIGRFSMQRDADQMVLEKRY